MFGMSSKGGGMAQAFPDVCKTPAPPAAPIPFPYPNMAMLNQAKKESKKVKVKNKGAVTMGSKVGSSSGDEPGLAGGLVSSKKRGEAKPKKGSSKVKVEGKAAVFQLCIFGHNGSNANMPVGCHTTPSQTKVTILY